MGKYADISHDGSMVLLYLVTWIPSIYTLYVSIYTIHGSYGYERIYELQRMDNPSTKQKLRHDETWRFQKLIPETAEL